MFTTYAAIQGEVINEPLSFSSSVFSVCVNFTIDNDNIALEASQEYNLVLVQPEVSQLQIETNTTRIIIIDDDGIKIYTHYILLWMKFEGESYYCTQLWLLDSTQLSTVLTKVLVWSH